MSDVIQAPSGAACNHACGADALSTLPLDSDSRLALQVQRNVKQFLALGGQLLTGCVAPAAAVSKREQAAHGHSYL